MAEPLTPPAIALEGVTAGYGREPVLVDLSLVVRPGEFVGAVGPSGSGKTTLLRLLTGQGRVQAGRVRVFGEDPRAPLRRRIGFVPQVDTVDWDFPITVEGVVLLGLTADSRRVPWFSREERRRAATVLERLGLDGLGRRQIRDLSGGQQQRMFLARALVRRSDLVLLDEPTSGVDLKTRHDVLHLLGELHREGMTIVLTTHDLNWVAAHLPRVVCLNRRVVADGAPMAVFTPGVLRETYGADLRVIRDSGMVFVADQTHIFAEPVIPGPARAAPPTAGGTGGLPHAHPHAHPPARRHGQAAVHPLADDGEAR